MATRLIAAVGEGVRKGLIWLVATLLWWILLILVFGAVMYLMGEIDGELAPGAGTTAQIHTDARLTLG
jgi:hypothetical protein